MYQLHSRKIKKNPKTLKFPPQEIISVKITNNNVKTMTYILSDTITFKTCRLKKKKVQICVYIVFPGGSEVEASASNAGDLGSIPGSGRSPGEGNGNSLQYSCLENPMDGGAW